MTGPFMKKKNLKRHKFPNRKRVTIAKMKKTILYTLASALLLGAGSARVWTSSDGTKTFEGDFVSCDDKTVTVKRGFKEMTFKLELLSEDDQKWAKEEQATRNAEKANEAAVGVFLESDFGKALSKASKLDGDKFAEHEITAPPRHFLLYFSASWCGPCRANAPTFAAEYKKDIATNPDLEVIHISLDREDGAAEQWAKSFEEPWPVILPSDVDQKVLVEPYNIRAVPSYVLVDQTGKEIARGKTAALAAAAQANP